ncbi:hypothetical protein PHLCEN_2v11245 [Hermanssonia centrifuga]|uniref:N-acetyltransferase domain-containing protein n=1 Tax=Hermanssonia centrifuga TaxID=98765 RepID=A0A2R6NKV7_9APHY|nr:hypothetical protein PHLCEN_2v11245 [Hermanssonia centrifuga]
MRQIPESCVSWWAEFLDVYDRFTDRAFGPGLKLDSYHLQLFGVAPEHHRKGVACALVQAVEQIAEPQHLPMCVETTHPSVISIYEKLGFHLVGTEMYKRADGSQGQVSALLKQL